MTLGVGACDAFFDSIAVRIADAAFMREAVKPITCHPAVNGAAVLGCHFGYQCLARGRAQGLTTLGECLHACIGIGAETQKSALAGLDDVGCLLPDLGGAGWPTGGGVASRLAGWRNARRRRRRLLWTDGGVHGGVGTEDKCS